MNDQHDNEKTDHEMARRYHQGDEQPLLSDAERKIRALACRGFSKRLLDAGQISEIRAFLTGNSDDCPEEYRGAYRAARERAARGGKQVYVYRLVITYPEGSREPGWRPALYDDPAWRKDLPLRARLRVSLSSPKFRWPRERMFISSDKAWGRAYWLAACGAEVTILRSQPVTWIDSPLQEFAGIKSNW